MRQEERYFLTLLRDHYRGTASAPPEGPLDWDALYEIARDQSLLGVCYAQLKTAAAQGAALPEDVRKRFHSAFESEVYLAVNRQAAMDELRAAFADGGIPFLPFKGWRIKELWPQPLLRTMGDVDILIRGEDRARADGILLSLGYEKYVDNQAVWTYLARDITLEIHDRMFYEHLAGSYDYRAFFDAAWDMAGGALDESFQFLYLLCHNAKHILNKGIGFRAFLDVAICGTKGAIRWDWVREKLEEIRLLGFAESSFALCRAWFGFEPPFPVPETERGFLERTTEKMFRDGTFGLENEENKAGAAAKEITHAETGYWRAALRLTLRRIFPPYGDLQLVPWYSFVDGRPWLLPVAWVYRWFYCLVKKRKAGWQRLTEPVVDRQEIRERQRQISDWNLTE